MISMDHGPSCPQPTLPRSWHPGTRTVPLYKFLPSLAIRCMCLRKAGCWSLEGDAGPGAGSVVQQSQGVRQTLPLRTVAATSRCSLARCQPARMARQAMTSSNAFNNVCKPPGVCAAQHQVHGKGQACNQGRVTGAHQQSSLAVLVTAGAGGRHRGARLPFLLCLQRCCTCTHDGWSATDC